MKTYWRCFCEVWQGLDGVLGALILGVISVAFLSIRYDTMSVTSFGAGVLAIILMVFGLPLIKCLDTLGQRPKVSDKTEAQEDLQQQSTED